MKICVLILSYFGIMVERGIGRLIKIVQGLNFGVTTYQYDSGQISGTWYTIEMIFNAISTKVPVWAIGWEGGRFLTNTIPGYRETFRPWVRSKVGLKLD